MPPLHQVTDREAWRMPGYVRRQLEIDEWFTRMALPMDCAPGSQTFLFTSETQSSDPIQWKKCFIPDDGEVKAERLLCDKVWERFLIKSPVLVKEVLSPTFALHFDIEAKGYSNKDHKHWGDLMKEALLPRSYLLIGLSRLRSRGLSGRLVTDGSALFFLSPDLDSHGALRSEGGPRLWAWS